MKRIVVGSMLLLVGITGSVYWSETSAERRCKTKLEAGDGLKALRECGRLLQSKTLFLDRDYLEVVNEESALVALQQQVLPAHDFIQGIHLVNLVLGGKETGLEAEARSIAANMPELHLAWTNQLIETGRADKAIQQFSVMRELYAKHPMILARVGTLEGRAKIAKAEHLIDEGDSQGVLTTLAELGTDVPLSLRAKAEGLVRDATRQAADRYLVSKDYPGLYRWLEKAKRHVHQQRDLVKQIDEFQSQYTQKIFGILSNGTPDIDEVEDLPPLLAQGSAPNRGKAVLTMKNQTGRRMTVQIKGMENHKLTIDAGSLGEVTLRSGEYVQLAEVGPGVRPYLGIILVDGKMYQQEFKVHSLDGTGQERRATTRSTQKDGTRYVLSR